MSIQPVYVMGPSGAGKDSLLAWLVDHWPKQAPWPRVHLARRTITRAQVPGGEAHEAVSPAEFDRLLAGGLFALHWQANGQHYGIRTTELEPPGATDLCVLVNGSRAHVAQAVACCPQLVVVHLTAPRALLAQRLQLRQREGVADIQARLDRPTALPDMHHLCPGRWWEVTNTGHLDTAGAQVLAALRPVLQATSACAGCPPPPRG